MPSHTSEPPTPGSDSSGVWRRRHCLCAATSSGRASNTRVAGVVTRVERALICLLLLPAVLLALARVHANSARSALYRVEQLVSESVVTVPRRLIAEAIDMVVFISGRGTGRRIEAVSEVRGLDADGDYAVTDLSIPHNLTPDRRDA